MLVKLLVFFYGLSLLFANILATTLTENNVTTIENNSTITMTTISELALLKNISKNSNENKTTNVGVDTEVNDLLHGGQFAFIINHNNASTTFAFPIPSENVTDSFKNVTANPELDLEWIEDGTNTEDDKFNRSRSTQSIATHNYIEAKILIDQGQLALILAGVLLIVAVLGYAVLLSWRQFLEKRYGTREMLINEEDFYDPNDMRHFSL